LTKIVGFFVENFLEFYLGAWDLGGGYVHRFDKVGFAADK
jgi:hypothetical protein